MMGAKSAVTDVFGTQEIETGHLLSANPNGWKRRCVCMIVLRASWGLAPQHPIPLSRRTMEGIADLGNGPSGYLEEIASNCMCSRLRLMSGFDEFSDM